MGFAMGRARFSIPVALANLQWALACLLVLVGAVLTGAATAQSGSGDALANDLCRNVVHVIARWNGSPRNDGFGFIVGEQGGFLYIVTANHVVRKNQSVVPDALTIVFFVDQGKEYQGALLDTYLGETEGDLAIIRIPPPLGFSWKTAALSSVTVERGDDVRFVGLAGRWDVPVRAGGVSGTEPNGDIRFENLTIRDGTSGGPLIGNKGFVGMIVQHSDVYGFALPIAVVERAVRGWGYQWQLVATGSPPPPKATSEKVQRGPEPPLPVNLANLYTTRENRDLWLGDIPRSDKTIGTRNVDLEECARDCAANSACVAFAYDRWNRACFAKNKTTLSLLDPHSLIAVKKPAELPNVSKNTPEMVKLVNQRMRGDVTTSKRVADYAACISNCEQDIQCVAFNFLKQAARDDNCQMLKLSDGHDDDKAVDAGYKHQLP